VPEFHRLLALVRCNQSRGETTFASTPSETTLTIRVTLLCAGATATSRIGGFPAVGEPLDSGGVIRASRLADTLPPAQVWSSPSCAARETAAALGLESSLDPLLKDIDYGDWSGRSFADVHQSDADKLERWLTDPNGGTPGGETMAQTVARAGSWLDRHSAGNRPVVAITHAMVIRACLVHALNIPADATLRIDIAPLTVAILSYNRIWRLQELRPL
jgi:broad specificity phosphatase PhoE